MTTNIAAVTVHAFDGHLPVVAATVAGWRDDVAVIVLACAAGLFVVAGVIRLDRWRLAGDPHSALVGCALVVMGALYLPLVGVAEISGALRHRDLGEALLRALVTFIAAGLVLGAVRAKPSRSRPRPTRLLPMLAGVVLLTFAALASAEMLLTRPLHHGSQTAQVLSVAMVLTWLTLALVVRKQAPQRPWSRRTPPLFGALAVAEAFYGWDPGAPGGTAAALIVCTGVAAAAAWSASKYLDLDLHQTEHTIDSLRETLRGARDETVELTEWRAHLVHDATNAVAGLRAALDVLNARQGAVDPASASLCTAATEEARHLDHLLHRAPDAPAEPFDAAAVVRSVGETARALGQDVSVSARAAPAVGRPGDLVVVLKNLLTNAARHAPGAPVHLGVEQVGRQLRVVCRDHGPGIDPGLAPHVFERGVRGPESDGSGLGLYGARMLMREQGGDLVLERVPSGARFVATLPAATRASATTAETTRSGRPRTGVPAQRRAPQGAARAGAREETQP
jgi:signal transduction histidine kinase